MNKYVLKQETIITPKQAGLPPFTLHSGAVYGLQQLLGSRGHVLTHNNNVYTITTTQAKDLIDRSKTYIEEID